MLATLLDNGHSLASIALFEAALLLALVLAFGPFCGGGHFNPGHATVTITSPAICDATRDSRRGMGCLRLNAFCGMILRSRGDTRRRLIKMCLRLRRRRFPACGRRLAT